MNALARFLAPRPLTLLCLAGILFAQSYLHRSAFIYNPDTNKRPRILGTSHFYGIAEPVELADYGLPGQLPEIKIRWGLLAANLAVSYLLSALLVWQTYAIQRRRRLFLQLARLAAGVIAAAFFLSILASKLYWNYWFHPPGPLAEMDRIAEVNTVVPVTLSEIIESSHALVRGSDDFFLEQDLEFAADDEYRELYNALTGLRERGLLPEEYGRELPADLEQLLPVFFKSGLVVESDPPLIYSNYTSNGYLVDGWDAGKNRILYFSLDGHELGNDHFAHYEAVFTAPAGQPEQLTYLSGQHFNYDVAGFESMKWYVAWLYLIPLLFAVTAITLAFLAGLARVFPPWWTRSP